MSRLVWDLETKEPKEKGESWNEYRLHAGLGLAVIYDEDRDDWEIYGERDLERLAQRLEGATEVVSYNGVYFDHVVLDAALGRRLYISQEVDLWGIIRAARDGIVDATGTWKLGNVCRRTLGAGKIGEGALAPSLLRENRIGELASYCIRDVKLTRDLWRFIRNYGYVIDGDDKKLVVGVPVESEGT